MMYDYTNQPEVCKRCQKELTLEEEKGYIPKYGIVCLRCSEVLTGYDDLVDPMTREKIL